MSKPLTDEQFAEAIAKVWLACRMAGESDEQAEEKVMVMARFIAPERILPRQPNQEMQS